jgi:hypothetical protein
MEGMNQKSIERVVSQRALQMGSSFPCQICVVGFLCGICLTSLFLAALTSFGTFHFGPILFSSMSMDNSTSHNNISKSISIIYYFHPCFFFSFLVQKYLFNLDDNEFRLVHEATLLNDN